MANNKILIGLLVIILVGSLVTMFIGSTPSVSPQNYNSPAGGAVGNGDNQSGISTTTSANGSNSGTVNGAKTFTVTEVATHNSATSCYSIVNGNVYDLTSYINRHPNGSRDILIMCGKDDSASYDGQHGGQRKPEAELARLKVGILAQ